METCSRCGGSGGVVRCAEHVTLMDCFNHQQRVIVALRGALLEHRADLHGYSTRPCPTCKRSSEALGIRKEVPFTCAREHTDTLALKRLKDGKG